jgi:uncharacterized protein (DUF488 family)
VTAPLYTLGHGTAGADELAGLIRAAEIRSVVDVRTVPKSRRHPQFWREEMELWIPEHSASTYRWEPALGGFRKANRDSPNVALHNPSFRGYADYMESESFGRALNALAGETAAARVAILCSESLWWRCHRRLISDAMLLLKGVDVRHLMHDGSVQPHVPTAGVRIAEEGRLRYDVLFASNGFDGGVTVT